MLNEIKVDCKNKVNNISKIIIIMLPTTLLLYKSSIFDKLCTVNFNLKLTQKLFLKVYIDDVDICYLFSKHFILIMRDKMVVNFYYEFQLCTLTIRAQRNPLLIKLTKFGRR